MNTIYFQFEILSTFPLIRQDLQSFCMLPECYIAIIIEVKPPDYEKLLPLFHNCGFDRRTWPDGWSILTNVVIASIVTWVTAHQFIWQDSAELYKRDQAQTLLLL